MNFISSFFMDSLQFIYGLVGNYGWSVVLFTLLVRFVLLPLDIKSKKSMRAMNKVQPQMQALQKKYAKDKDKLNQKMQELYKREKVNPLAGCLPMLIQLPILWFMFGAMRSVANEHTVQMLLNLRDGQEIALQSWLWIKNVFQPDSFMSTILPQAGASLAEISAVAGSKWLTQENVDAVRAFLQTPEYVTIAARYGADQFSTIPLNFFITTFNISLPASFAALFEWANGLCILPVLAGVSQYFMTKLTAGPQQNQQPQEGGMNMNSGFMKWFFPIFSIWICLSSNAAFAIYWMAVNVIQIAQTYVVNLYFDRKDRLEALNRPETPVE